MRFGILGPLVIRADHAQMTVTAGRDRVVLATLLLHAGRIVPFNLLADAVWGEDPPDTARSQLHNAIWRLRRTLAIDSNPDEVITTDPAGYRVEVGPDDVDALVFTRFVNQARADAAKRRLKEAKDQFRAALDLWRGPALAGIASDVVRRGAEALDERRVEAIEDCLDVELELGEAADLVAELTELAAQHPFRERLHAALMLALYRAGRQADALAAYRNVRQVLHDQLGIEPGSALRDLHHRILTGDELLTPAARDAAPAATAGNRLPRAIDDFTGRRAEVARLIEAVDRTDPDTPLALTIDGMAGVGKTALAVHVAHMLVPRYPDRQLFIDLHGHSQYQPVTPAAALDTLLRQLGVSPTRIPADLDERIALWRDELAARRALVVLDNAATTAQVAPLLPAGGSCLAILTSRRRMVDLDAVRPVSLGTLSPEEAVSLLEDIVGDRVGSDPRAAAEVARRCGYLPLALRLAAARLAHRPRWRIGDLADRLHDARTALTELTAGDRNVTNAFALSYGHLSPAGQRLFRLLGLHPGDTFDSYAAAALADLRLADAQELLDELGDGHLIQELHANRYRLHDLVRDYAADLAQATDPEPERRSAVGRLLDYYLHGTAAVSEHVELPASLRNFQPGEPKRPDLIDKHRAWGTDWLDVERPNLTAAVRHAATHGYDQYGWQIARAMWWFLFKRGYIDDLVMTHRLGIAAAARLGHEDAVATTRNYLASGYLRMGRYQEAADLVLQTLARRRQTGDRVGEAIAQKNLAMVRNMQGRLGEAAQGCELALATARRTEDSAIIVAMLTNLSLVYLTQGRYTDALAVGRRGLALAREAGLEYYLAIGLGHLGKVRARLGQHDRAFRLLNAALSIKRRLENRFGEGEVLNDLGGVYRALGRHDEAMAHHRDALVIMREAGDRYGECAVFNDLARTLHEVGDTTTALELHQRALSAATKIQMKYEQARALDGIGACLRTADPHSARRHWLRALHLYQEMGVPERHDVERHLADLA